MLKPDFGVEMFSKLILNTTFPTLSSSVDHPVSLNTRSWKFLYLTCTQIQAELQCNVLVVYCKRVLEHTDSKSDLSYWVIPVLGNFVCRLQYMNLKSEPKEAIHRDLCWYSNLL